MTADGSGRSLLLFESNHLIRRVQYLLYDQLSLTVETFRRATVPHVGNSFVTYTVTGNVPTSVDLL